MVRATEHLIGRAKEIDTLEELLGQVEDDRSVALEIVGEPGIGKTRLLAELAARAETRGYLVLSGAASETERDLPFSVFIDTLDEFLAGLEPGRLAALDVKVRAELGHIFPSLSALAGSQEVALQSERYRSHRAVRELLEQLAGTTPVVLVLDDNEDDFAYIKVLLGKGKTLSGRELHFDALAMKFREFKRPHDPKCPVCGEGKKPEDIELIDYNQFCQVRN